MQGINHTIVGGIIAITVKQPVLVVPLALASHFVMDIIPHYGSYQPFRRGTRAYYRIIVVDGLASTIAYLVMIHLWPQHVLAISLGVFFALLPDLLWPLALYIKQRGPLWAFYRFHKGIQHESGRGIFTEAVWLLVMVRILVFLY